MPDLIYIASPYTHPDAFVRVTRFHEAVQFLRWLLKQKRWAYSPIVHCHDVALGGRMPVDFEFWKAFNDTMLSRCQGVYVLQLDGWKDSKGIEYEIAKAGQLDLPVQYWTHEDEDNYAYRLGEA